MKKMRIIPIFLVLFSIIFLVYAATYYQVASGTTEIIDEFGTCKEVTNNNAQAIFIPTNSEVEWTAFRDNALNIVLAECLDCSILDGDWILVPGNSNLGTSDFCVMKYEAKDVSGIATSQAALTPWESITQLDAISNCSALGTGYHLISDAEWVTIGRNVEVVSSNWADGNIGSTVDSGGGLFRGNVGTDDSISYNGADPADRSLDTNSKAILTLSNGEIIWDLSGNVLEWTSDTFNTNSESALGQASSTAYEWTSISGYDYLESSVSSYDSSYGIGQVYADVDNAYPSGTTHAFFRGSNYNSGITGGIFSLSLGTSPSYSSIGLGFRCSYTK